MALTRLTAGAAAAATALALGAGTAAAEYPERAITWVIPFGAGGGSDRLARMFAAEAEEHFGVALNVENHPGAGSVAGWQHVLNQPADGYTVFNATPTPVITLLTEEDTPVDPGDITILGYLGAFASVLVVREDEFPDWDSFVAALEERPVTIGGTNALLLGAANVLSQAGVEAIYVPYASTGESVTDFLGGHIDVAAVTESTAMTIVPENGIALINTSSIPLTEDVDAALGGDIPMARDFGYRGIAFPRWVGMHPDTPEEIMARFAEIFEAAATDPEIQAIFEEAGEPIIFLNREEAAADYADMVEAMRNAVTLLD
jgi:tripartite-type tricarboxylate transporter receptor subunit TctC